jgi:hypothetical protein
MTRWLARQALRLYPLAHQRRYGEEIRALLEDRPPRAGTLLDLLKGATRAHLRPGDAPPTTTPSPRTSPPTRWPRWSA